MRVFDLLVKGSNVGYFAGKVLQNPFINYRIGIKKLADALQFRSVGMVDADDHERHMFFDSVP